VTRGWLPQRAGSPSLNGGGIAAAVPPKPTSTRDRLEPWMHDQCVIGDILVCKFYALILTILDGCVKNMTSNTKVIQTQSTVEITNCRHFLNSEFLLCSVAINYR